MQRAREVPASTGTATSICLQRHQLRRHERPLALRESERRDKGKKRKKTDNPREGWEDGTPPPHRDFKERGVMR